jgi:hypothetical protein
VERKINFFLFSSKMLFCNAAYVACAILRLGTRFHPNNSRSVSDQKQQQQQQQHRAEEDEVSSRGG